MIELKKRAHMDMGAQRNYACVNCGRVFGRIFCANRHATNRVCGNGRILPLADYLAGLQIGMYYLSPIYRKPPVNKGEGHLFDRKRLDRKFSEKLEEKWIEKEVEQAVGGLRRNELTVIPVIPEQRDIFGYKGLVCKKCPASFIGAVYFGDRRYDRRHICEPYPLDRSMDLGVQEQRIIEEFLQKLPLKLKNFVCTWLPSSRAILRVIELSDSWNEPIKIRNPKNPDEAISIICAQEKFIELTTSDNLSLNHWAIRAIRDGRTSLTDAELTNYLKRVVDATFAVVAVKWPSVGTLQEKLKKLYFTYLAIN